MNFIIYILYTIAVLCVIGVLYHSIKMLLTNDREEQDYHGFASVASIVVIVLVFVLKEFLINYIY